ncbi:MAG: quinoprotein glucose dehydrogenase [Candidatus Azotimanducaceae bacterium]|jgi:quinoprotein glucose dehydrogenase
MKYLGTNLLPSLLILVTLGTDAVASAEDKTINWPHYGGSEKGNQHSIADQITRDNVSNLKEVWRFRTGELGQGSTDGYSFQSNPILIEGRLYVTTGSAIIIAIDPLTGTELWRFDPKIDRTKATAETANRGASSWIDDKKNTTEQCHHQIYTGTLDGRLISVDGVTGKPCLDFGEAGEIFLTKGIRLAKSTGYEYSVTSPPVIVNGIIVTGSSIGDNRGVKLELGIVRGFDARTGKEIWRFDPIPRTVDDAGFSEWIPAQAKKSAAANAWAPLAADSELGLVYVPTGSVSPDFYGGERKGDNRYANSLVALNARTGKIIWHQQLIHHDVWDYDLPAQPTLVELKRDGVTIPAVIQGTKTGLIFTFNRKTGEPIFEIEERPVPQGGVMGEHLSKTQPFPVAPPPLLNHAALTGEDAWGMLLFDKWGCAEQFEQYRSEGIYTPPSLEGTLMMPPYMGGINWGGIAFHPQRQIAIARVTEAAAVVQLIERKRFDGAAKSQTHPESEYATQSDTPYGMRRELILSPIGIPCSAPPWGWLKAVDMTSGEILWQVPHGTIEDIAPAMVPNLELGVPGIGGPITTAGDLIFIAAAMDDYLRAFDISNGAELWRGRLPAGGQATPMTYAINGKQYVVIAAGGHRSAGTNMGDYVIAFSLESK